MRQIDVGNWINTSVATNPSAAFLWLTESLMKSSCNQLHMDIGEDYELTRVLFSLAQSPVLKVIEKTCALELNIARIQSRLRGTNEAERYCGFIALLKTEEFRDELFSRYPHLKVLIYQILERWRKNSASLVAHLNQDRAEIAALIEHPWQSLADSRIVKIIALGDSHAHGKQVCLIDFKNGSQVIYKPRSILVDEKLLLLTKWFSLKGLEPVLKLPRVLAREDYGWAERIRPRPSQSIDEVSDFYRRLGAWLAIFQTFGSTDFHFDNFVIAGDQPVPVDLETFFHPQLNPVEIKSSDQMATTCKNLSVLSIGVLPHIRAQAGETSQVFRVPQWRDVGSDTVHIARVPARREDRSLEPIFKDKVQHIWDYAGVFEMGFTLAYDIMCRHKAELMAANFFRDFSTVSVRLVARPTMSYIPLLSESFHPHLLDSADKRASAFSTLSAAKQTTLKISSLVESEIKQLENCDVPSFYSQCDSYTVTGGDGTPIEEILSKSAFDVARERITALGSKDFMRQRWFVRTSIASAAHVQGSEVAFLPEQPRPWQSLQDSAGVIGDWLADTAFVNQETASWVSHRKGDRHGVTIIGSDLYDGHAGVVLFLAYLDHCGGRKVRDLSEMALASIWQNENTAGLESLFSGVFGHLYLYAHLGHLWQKERFYDQSSQLLEKMSLPVSENEKRELDIISGVAGAIASLVVCYKTFKIPKALLLATRYAEILCSLQKSDGSWPQLSVSRGFSHGTSGLAWSLLQMFQMTGEHSFQNAALKALKHEQSLLKIAWVDWEMKGGSVQASWCHGAPGIGLALAAAQESSNADWIQEGLDSAITASLQTPPPRNHSLCHGEVGNAVILASLRDYVPHRQREIDNFIEQSISKIAVDVQSWGFKSAAPGKLPVAGLMTGLAGVGIGLLKLAYPSVVPNVLSLQGPIFPDQTKTFGALESILR